MTTSLTNRGKKDLMINKDQTFRVEFNSVREVAMWHLKPEGNTNVGSVCRVTNKADGGNWTILSVQLLCNH